MKDKKNFNITISEWITFLQIEISTKSNHISLLHSLTTDQKVMMSTSISLLLVGILAFINATTLSIIIKMGCILIVLIMFLLFLYLNNQYWNDKFFKDLEQNSIYIADLKQIFAKILEEELTETTEVKKEYMAIVNKNFIKNKT
ncbi:MAG: hypothetical protein NT038_08045 [Euryarchaeota archaeon]|nr:hypothetical protein [Euryarchaeota archaeon]